VADCVADLSTQQQNLAEKGFMADSQPESRAQKRDTTNTDRLPEFADTRLPRIERQLQAAIPIYPDLEKLTLSYSLERMREYLGPDHPTVRMLLVKDSPDSLAAKLVDGSKLADPAIRSKLWQDSQATAVSKDPMIELARTIDPNARAIRKQVEDHVEAPIRSATKRIAAARFASLGTNACPDATCTLRLNFGTVQGWTENGRDIDPYTRLGQLYERTTGADPFRLLDSWLAAAWAQLNMQTLFNVSTNNDIVGGNSGSPLINAKGELVGLMFDGNIHSLSI
jgi:hypothetical protein